MVPQCERFKTKILWIVAILNILLASTRSLAMEPPRLDIASIGSHQDVTSFGIALFDGAERTPAAIEKVILAEGEAIGKVLHGGYSDGTYWIRLRLWNSADTPKIVNLIAKNLVISRFEAVIVDAAPGSAVIDRVHARIPTLRISLPPAQELNLLLNIQFGLHEILSLEMEKVEPNAPATSDKTIQGMNIFLGAILAMTLFNAGLFLLTRDKIFILHALVAILISANLFILSGLSYFILGTDYWNFYIPVLGNYGVAGALFFGQYYLNARSTHPRLHRCYTIGGIVGLVGGTLLLAGVTKRLVYLTDVNLLISPIISMSVIYYFSPRKHRMMRFYVIGWMGLDLMVLVGVAAQYRYLPLNFFTENAFSIGLSIEMIVVSLGLADQINHYKNKLEGYNRGLEVMVEEKTRDIRSIMEHIPLGIFMIKAGLGFHEDRSKNILEIFPNEDLDHANAGQLIFAKSNLSSDAISQAHSCLEASLGEDIVNFDANSQTLPIEIVRTSAGGESRIFDMTWNPIQSIERRVDKILVTMRDVTDMRNLQARSKDQQEELEFIGEILSVPTPRFLKFIQSCRELLQENAKLIRAQDKEQQNIEVLKLLFINMHTVKGSARSLYLKKMSNVFHEVEQYYAHLQKSSSTPWDISRMEKDLAEAQGIIDLYERIAREKLGRSMDCNQLVEFRIDRIESAYRDLSRAIRGKTLPADVMAGIHQVNNLFQAHIFKDSREVIKELCGCLPLLSKDLHKEMPEVVLDTGHILIGDRGEELLRNVFVHLLRNTMDHGIEDAKQRVLKNKKPQGTITVRMEHQDDNVIVTYSDDGKGLNIPSIRALGLSRGLLDAREANDIHSIAQLIFDSGLSTVNRVTEISGRGVGMNAVRQFIQKYGGTISIVLHPEDKDPASHVPFSLVMNLPFPLFEEALPEDLSSVA
ncbi:MAG TPA: 7TM diverse intracellular signaling domain-containing protein [Oligoflexus sp.]|uniref:7TM diverse intracellular signaling domain-containing protein n=1 Tax=Oligoflexus sp. TaxID=1971216 RepID=UPI002D233F8F|nr:7TM diverse intracellular signaling domain-containing protein [Oligoflexus sp.]HYX33398.1 7TM diverse intracellular signaling domain-containing protein [Oligoflexus sp.]